MFLRDCGQLCADWALGVLRSVDCCVRGCVAVQCTCTVKVHVSYYMYRMQNHNFQILVFFARTFTCLHSTLTESETSHVA